MKRITLLLMFLSLFWACQKREYPTFNYSQAAYMHQPEAVAPTNSAAVEVVTVPQPLLASADEGLSALTEKEVPSVTIPYGVDYIKAEQQAMVIVADKAAPAKMTWQQKVVARKIQKQINKVESPEKNKAAKAKPDTIALLSLIFGGTGLLLLLLGTGLGLLLGIAGLVMGIVGLSRIKKDKAPASSKTMALLGLIFGGVVTLVGLIVVAAISSYGFY